MTKYNVDCSNLVPDIEDMKVTALSSSDSDMAKFGNLVIELALGSKTMPADPADHNSFLETEGGLVIPEGVNVEIIQQQMNDIKIMIPPKEMIEAAICDAQAQDAAGDTEYTGLPDAYEKVINGTWTDSLERFYEVRVADYTLGYCK